MSKYSIINGKEVKGKFGYFRINPRGRTEDQLIAVNHKFIAANWEGARGQIAILEKNNPHNVKPSIPLIYAHNQPINNVRWSPFVSNLLASSSDEGTIKLWKIPEDGLKENVEKEDQKFFEHTKKVNLFKFHPSSADVIGSSSTDSSIKLWSIINAKSYFSIITPESLTSLDWNYDGSLIGGCKTSLVYIYDPRTQKEICKITGSSSTKAQKMTFLSTDALATIGFGKECREIKLFDTRNYVSPVNTVEVDKEKEFFFPYYDYERKILYLPGRSSTKIHFYSYADGNIKILHEKYCIPEPAQFFTFEESRFADWNSNELTRMYHSNKEFLTMTSFYIPRKNGFDKDLFPSLFSGESALTGEEWANGSNKTPILKPIDQINKDEGIKNVEMIKYYETTQELSLEDKVNLLKEENQTLKEKLKEKRSINEELTKEVERLRELVSKK